MKRFLMISKDDIKGMRADQRDFQKQLMDIHKAVLANGKPQYAVLSEACPLMEGRYSLGRHCLLRAPRPAGGLRGAEKFSGHKHEHRSVSFAARL